MLVKYFKQTGELWQINPDIRAMVQLRQLNLLQDFSHLGTFDVIFCRNVLIYFDQDTKVGIFDAPCEDARTRWLAGSGRRRIRGRVDRRVQALSRRRGLYRPNRVRSPALVPGMPSPKAAARA